MTSALLLAGIVAILGTSPPPDPADALFPLVGERVRVVKRPRTIAADGIHRSRIMLGTLMQYDGETLVLTQGGKRWTVPRTQVDRVDVSLGRRSLIARGAKSGAIAGASIGFLMGLACVDNCGVEGGVARMGAATVGLGAIGAAAGAVLAAPFSGERWDEVRVTRSVRLSPTAVPHGLGLALSLRWPGRRPASPSGRRVRPLATTVDR